MNWHEEIRRGYDNGVAITYESIDEENLYIHSITSMNKMNGIGTETFINFLNEFKGKNIYIFSSDELGTDKKILDKWYKKLGFIVCSNDIGGIPYNCTHVKVKSI